MKIGIITQPLHANYGGILQCYALQTVLQKMGHEVEVIQQDWFYNTKPLYIACKALYICATNIIQCKWKYPLPDIKIKHEVHVEGRYTHEFVRKYIHVRKVRTLRSVKESDYDAYVVGSDQVWRYLYNDKHIFDSYLRFTKNWHVRRMSYAASFGLDVLDYPQKIIPECQNLLQKFDLVTVRESTGVDLCKNYFAVEAKQVLDPTLLLHATDYDRLTDDIKGKEISNTLVTYILDETEATKEIVHQAAILQHLTVVRANSKYEDHAAPLEERVQPPVESWLAKLSTADFVIADSFHACVFSIIFRRQFLIVANKKRGIIRLQSLLEMLDIKGHLITPDISFDINTFQSINYDKVEAKLKLLRQQSIALLKEGIEANH